MFKTFVVNLALLIVVVAVMVALFWVALPYLPRYTRVPRISSTPVLLTQVKTLSQLVTVKYVLEKVVLLEDESHWYELQFGENRLLMVAHGIVKAGVNLDELKPGDISVSGNKISLTLPPPRITDSYLDDNLTQIIDRKTGLLRSFDKDLEQNARRQAVEDINRAARNSGILKDAGERAKSQLTNFFHLLGYEEVDIRDR
ncbi:MAG TPA: DUF4230 domain-containing protein [Verrucomicrobiae bacterium]|jgi:hypothetical protein|nr:DUF4230 domain-containing protein [Verrucomicrobiae bacterium]